MSNHNNNTDNNMSMPTNTTQHDNTTVQVHFVSSTCESVGDSLYSIPTRLSRYGLSEIINHLLLGSDALTEQYKPYDFLVNNTFLRTTLDKYIKKNQLQAVCK